MARDSRIADEQLEIARMFDFNPGRPDTWPMNVITGLALLRAELPRDEFNHVRHIVGAWLFNRHERQARESVLERPSKDSPTL